jgi:cutinase
MPLVAIALVLSLLSPLVAGAETACSSVSIIGVRGSGQTAFGDQVGGVVEAVSSEIAAIGGSVSQLALDYPAVSISDNFGLALFNGDYNRSVAAGTANLSGILDDLGSQCPRTVIVLVGYSQGAQVIKDAMADRDPIDRIASVVLLADPTRETFQLGVRRIGNLVGVGALGSEPLAEHIRPITIDVCAETDSVCSGRGLDFESHINGYRTVADEVVQRVLRDIENSTIAYRRFR